MGDQKEVWDLFEKLCFPEVTEKLKDVKSERFKFVHYTSAENALKIIKSNSIWLRDARCMNDYMEIHHGYQMLRGFFSDGKNSEKFNTIFSNFYPGFGESIFASFNDLWSSVSQNVFIASLSEHDATEYEYGRLSMWRAYGQAANKAALVLNIPLEDEVVAAKLRLFFRPVYYYNEDMLSAELHAIMDGIDSCMETIQSLGSENVRKMMLATLILLAVCLKHRGFTEEREWRVIYLPKLFPSQILSCETEAVGGVPQKIYKVPLHGRDGLSSLEIKNFIDHILIGPSLYPLTIGDAFIDILVSAGVDSAAQKVFFSNIPLRT